MQNQMLNMMMGILQNRNPQMFQAINIARNNGTKPQDMIKQMMGNVNPQQMQNVIQQAKQMGCPDNILNQIQNFK